MKRFIVQVIERLKSELSLRIRRDRILKIGLFVARLPPGHRLPEYRRVHNKYDSFLPVLATILESPGVILDIGANVGDTTLSMASTRPDLKYVCFEPQHQFYQYMKRNFDAAKSSASNWSNLDFELHNVFIGQRTSGILKSNGTTATVDDRFKDTNKEMAKVLSLDQAIETVVTGDRFSNILLIKIDVDGYDWDVINSGINTIKNHLPLIYFEAVSESLGQIYEYEITLRLLNELNYQFFVFDCYGNYALNTKDISILNQLIFYSFQSGKNGKGAPPYFDILATTPAKAKDVLDLIKTEYEV